MPFGEEDTLDLHSQGRLLIVNYGILTSLIVQYITINGWYISFRIIR